MNFINDGGELGVLGVERVDGVHGRVEVLDVLGVHLEEGRVLDHDVPDPLVLGVLAPLRHPLLQLSTISGSGGGNITSESGEVTICCRMMAG